MDAFTDEQKAIHEELWRAWIRNGKLRHKATVRKLKMVAEFGLGLLVVGSVIYISVPR
jgi:hypothetical protein